MKKLLKSVSAFAFITAFASLNLTAQEVQFNGILSAAVSPALGCYDKDNAGKMVEDNLTAEGTLKVLTDNCSAFVDGSVTYDGVSDEYDCRLKESWVDWNCSSNFAVRIGRQIAGWGKADELQVADVLCPQDLTTVLSSDYSDTRLGIDAVRFSLMGNVFSSDLYWIPHFTPGKLPESVKKPIYGCIYGEGAPDSFKTPEKSLKNSEAALRINASFPAVDFALYGFAGWDDEPVIVLNDDNDEVIAEYKRMWMVGCDAAIPVKDFVFRLEAAYFPKKFYGVKEAFMDGDYTLKRDTVKALGGIDWSIYPFDITAQYYIEAVSGNLDEIDKERYSQQTTLSISRTFLNEQLEVSLSGALHLKDYDNMVEFQAIYAVTDNLKLTGQVDLYNSGRDDKEGEYGAYKKLSSGTLKVEYRF